MAEQYNKSHRRAGYEAKQRSNDYLNQNYDDPAVPRVQKLIEQMLVYLHSVLIIHNIKGGKKLMRIIWDRPQYRKDYLCDYFKSNLPGGHVIAYEAETSFYRVNSKKAESK